MKALILCLALVGCQTTASVTDSYCSLYVKVVQDKGDGSITATSGAKRRILANELTYRKLCTQ